MVDVEECVGCRALHPELPLYCVLDDKPISFVKECPIEIRKKEKSK